MEENAQTVVDDTLMDRSAGEACGSRNSFIQVLPFFSSKFPLIFLCIVQA
jgi:hypothetical protein